MSALSSFLDWFGRQTLWVQVAATTLLFGALFALGVPTYGLVPGLIVAAVLVEHWWNG